MNRGTGTTDRRPWRNSIALAAAVALILTPGTTFGAEEGGGHSGGGGGGMGGGGEDTSPGNNLSMPVIWTEAEGLRPTLREAATPLTAILGTLGTDGTITPLDATYVLKDDAGTKDVVEQNPLFLQKTVNSWQADNVELADSGLALSDGRLPVTYLDWGDNLEAKDWSTKQMVRVETRLVQKVDGMTGYVMKKVFGQGQTEMWGVLGKQVPVDPEAPVPSTDPWSATDEERTEAFAYTSNACLTIERIDRATSLTWDPGDRAWTPDGKSICVGDVTEGPGGYGAEVTVSGGMTYGYVWHARGAEAGLYRLTFSLKPGAGVDIAPSTERYVSATTEEGGSGHKPPGAGGHETATEPTTDAASAEEGGTGGGTDAGSKPVPNVPVIVPELDLSYIDVGLDYSPTVPSMPLNLKAVRGVEQIALTWEPPVYDGMGAITEYVVNGVRDEDGTVLPAQRIAAGTPLTAAFAGLVGGEPYTFTVVAVNGQGPGVPASVTTVPKVKPAVSPPVVNPSTPAAPSTAAPPAKVATITVKAVSGRSKLFIDVDPNKGKGYWQVMIQRKAGKVWKVLPKVYRTKGSAETLTVNLPKGSYRAVVLPKYTHAGAMSGSVTLKR